MRYAHILSRVTGSPWFIHQPALEAISDVLEARLKGAPLARSDFMGQDAEADDEPETMQIGSVQVIPVFGMLGKHLSGMEMSCGGCDYDAIVTDLRAGLQRSDVSAAILHFDSPGGNAVGCSETYAEIVKLRALTGKKVYAFCDTKCCSAAMYLAAACDAVFCTESAMLGSCGTILKLEDRSGQLAQEGIRRFVIKSASMKDIMSPDRAATPEELTALQARIDYLGGLFKRDLTAGRPGLASEVTETALFYFGTQAVAVGLADEVVPSLAALVAGIEGDPV